MSAQASSASAGSSESISSAAVQPLGQSGSWNLIFSDEFSGTALDRAKWTPGWFGTGITGPVNSGEGACYDSRHVTLPGDGTLHLRLDATPNTCKGHSMSYTGALVSSNGLFEYAFGYAEFRVYLPASSSGTIANWPATWSDGHNWPEEGENDTMEGLGGPACYHFHSTAGGPGSCASGNYSGWHTFASNWQPGIVTYFYDGVKVGQITTGITSVPQYLVLDYTFKATRTPTVPNEMRVDYVRIWKSSPFGDPCESAGLAADHSSPQTAGTQVVFTSTATGCSAPEFSFQLLTPGGAWTQKRGYASGASWTWNTSSLEEGVYQVGVWARQAGSPSAYDTYAITTFAVGLGGCVSAGLSSAPAPPQVRGGTIAVNATSTGCAAPRYQFWILPPGGSWTTVQPYGTGSSWNFDTTKYPAGRFQLGVWVRQLGSTKSYDSFFISSYEVTSSTGCVVGSLSPSASAPRAVGTSITFTPQTTNCSKQYQYWLLPPGGAWKSVRAYSAIATWTWDTSDLAPGAYQVGVWEGSAASPSTYEAYAITTFILGVVTCTAAHVDVSPAQPQSPGSSITATASATRCGNPQYQYWLRTPGGAWTAKPGYGGGTWSWDTTTLAPGTYQLGVWAREAGSTAPYDTYFIRTYEIS